MSIPFHTLSGFAGASGVGILCLIGLFLIVSVFATNLPTVATLLIESSTWSAIASLPLLVVAYVIGLLAIALIDPTRRSIVSELNTLRDGPMAVRYVQLEQEGEILSGSVVAFLLLGCASLLHITVFPGWTRTLLFSAVFCGLIALSAWKMSRTKHNAAANLLISPD